MLIKAPSTFSFSSSVWFSSVFSSCFLFILFYYDYYHDVTIEILKGKKRRQGPLDDQTPGFSDMLLTLQNTILRNNEGITSKKNSRVEWFIQTRKGSDRKKKKKGNRRKKFFELNDFLALLLRWCSKKLITSGAFNLTQFLSCRCCRHRPLFFLL